MSASNGYLLAALATIVLVVVPLTWGIGAYLFFRWASARAEKSLGERPQKTVWEWLFSLTSTSPREIELIVQRAQKGTQAYHPMGPPIRRHWLDDLTWNLATLGPYAIDSHRVETGVRIGPRAKRPLELALPVLPAPMGWGVALRDEAKAAIAEATSLAGTAANSGEGPFLPDERALAERWILQASRAGWAHQAPVVRQADMVEIQLGQASEGEGAVKRAADSLPAGTQRALDGAPRLVIHAGRVRPLDRWIAEIRRINPDIPVGVKIPATAHVEEDVRLLCQLGVDAITLDGSAAGTAQSPAVIHDSAAIPAELAVRRADRFLRAVGLRHAVSLMTSGGLRGGADIAKVLALGADAAMLGTSVLFAASHGQIAPVLPFTPPTAPMFAGGAAPFRPALAAQNLYNWFFATRRELQQIAAVLGLSDLGDIGPEHLVCEVGETARMLGVASTASPWAMNGLLMDEVVLSYGALFGVLRGTLDRLAPGGG